MRDATLSGLKTFCCCLICGVLAGCATGGRAAGTAGGKAAGGSASTTIVIGKSVQGSTVTDNVDGDLKVVDVTVDDDQRSIDIHVTLDNVSPKSAIVKNLTLTIEQWWKVTETVLHDEIPRDGPFDLKIPVSGKTPPYEVKTSLKGHYVPGNRPTEFVFRVDVDGYNFFGIGASVIKYWFFKASLSLTYGLSDRGVDAGSILFSWQPAIGSYRESDKPPPEGPTDYQLFEAIAAIKRSVGVRSAVVQQFEAAYEQGKISYDAAALQKYAEDRKARDCGNDVRTTVAGNFIDSGCIEENSPVFRVMADRCLASLKKGDEDGDAAAQMAWAYSRGAGVRQIFKESLKLAKESAEKGNIQGINWVAELLGQMGDPDAPRWAALVRALGSSPVTDTNSLEKDTEVTADDHAWVSDFLKNHRIHESKSTQDKSIVDTCS
jgi:hypothetical protein